MPAATLWSATNVPYSGRKGQGHTIRVHGARRGIPHALIEMRADEVADADGTDRFVDILGGALESVLTHLPAG